MSTDNVVLNYPIPSSVHRDAKVSAAMMGVSLRQFVITALEQRAALVLAQQDIGPSRSTAPLAAVPRP